MRRAVEVTSSPTGRAPVPVFGEVLFRTGIPLRDTQPIRVVQSKAGDEFGSATASNRVKAIGIDWNY